MASLFELLGNINWGDLEGYNARESGLFEYSTSKLEILMFTRELNKRLKVMCPLFHAHEEQGLWFSVSVLVCFHSCSGRYAHACFRTSQQNLFISSFTQTQMQCNVLHASYLDHCSVH